MVVAGTVVPRPALNGMAKSVFDPSLDLHGIKARKLDDAAAFARKYVGARLPRRRDGILRQLEAASGEEQECEAANAFLAWVKAQGLP